MGNKGYWDRTGPEEGNGAWVNTPASIYEVFQCPSGKDDLIEGVNYNYNAYIGFCLGGYDRGWPVNPKYKPRKLSRQNASDLVVIVDGLKQVDYHRLDYTTSFSFRHNGGINFLFCDGHVKWYSQGTVLGWGDGAVLGWEYTVGIYCGNILIHGLLFLKGRNTLCLNNCNPLC